MAEKKQSDGAAWKKRIKTKFGEATILSITIGDKRYTAWENSYKKEGDNQPDYKIFVDIYEKKGYDGASTPATPQNKSYAPAPPNDTDLPF
jgi:hypothetical protein